MTKSELFTRAHQIAKKNVALVGNYLIAFSIALKEVYNSMKNKLVTFANLDDEFELSMSGAETLISIDVDGVSVGGIHHYAPRGRIGDTYQVIIKCDLQHTSLNAPKSMDDAKALAIASLKKLGII